MPHHIDLAPEDLLRLNVLMAGDILAVRIDEASLSVHALTQEGESGVRLNPNTGVEIYLRRVREFLAGSVLDSPGGYPVYLQRWTRMGQAREEGLDRLLLLGEPEAVVSVAYSPGLTDELARRAWWAMPTPDNARRMLERECVARGSMGRVLAEFLIEHLPFEQDAWQILDTMRTVLPLVDAETREKLWRRGRQSHAYRTGFLEYCPDALPTASAPHPDQASLASLAGQQPDNPWLRALARLASPSGQIFLATAGEILARPGSADIAAAVLDSIGHYFSGLPRWLDAGTWQDEARDGHLAGHLQAEDSASEARRLLEGAGLAAAHTRLLAVATLAQSHAGLATPILRRSNASGTLLRRKLEPVTGPLMAALRHLHEAH